MELKLFLFIILSENYDRIKSIFRKKKKIQKHINIYAFVYICSAQSRNRYNSGIVPAQSKNSHFAGQSKNSHLVRFNSGIVPAQRRNQDKVRIYT